MRGLAPGYMPGAFCGKLWGMEVQPEIRIPISKKLELDPPREGETEKEKERRLLMNSFKSGMNIALLRQIEEADAREKALKEEKEREEAQVAESKIRVMGARTVSQEDLRPDPFHTPTEDVVANPGNDGGFEKRTDFDLEKGKREE